MIENLTDDQILAALRHSDEKVTCEFFYDTCRMAYHIDAKKYGLNHKSGMDFYSLAHEYYLRLCNNHWVQLEKRTPDISLAKWTMNGFHYLVRERLSTYSNGMKEESVEERAAKGKVIFDAPNDTTQEEVQKIIEDICHSYYKNDRKSQSILRMILIMGMKGKEVAKMMGITPSAVSQRYRTMMDEVVRPYFINYYVSQPSSYPRIQTLNFANAPYTLQMEKEYKEQIYGTFPSSHFDLCRGPKREGRVTPNPVRDLGENGIFVFGSDLHGIHCGGTAYQALRSFGAQLGNGVGPQGRCYAIPTIVGGIDNIRPYVEEFFSYASNHPELLFLVTPIGCGIAGFTPQEIAPLFRRAKLMGNIHLPEEFWEVLDDSDKGAFF